ADLVADIEVELTVAWILRVFRPVVDRIRAQLAPLQSAKPGPEVVDEYAERADERRRVGNVGPVQAVRRQVAAIARLGEGQVRVELDPADRPVFAGELDTLATARSTGRILSGIRVVAQLRVEILLEHGELQG